MGNPFGQKPSGWAARVPATLRRPQKSKELAEEFKRQVLEVKQNLDRLAEAKLIAGWEVISAYDAVHLARWEIIVVHDFSPEFRLHDCRFGLCGGLVGA